jgi:hypothetical protein
MDITFDLENLFDIVRIIWFIYKEISMEFKLNSSGKRKRLPKSCSANCERGREALHFPELRCWRDEAENDDA